MWFVVWALPNQKSWLRLWCMGLYSVGWELNSCPVLCTMSDAWSEFCYSFHGWLNSVSVWFCVCVLSDRPNVLFLMCCLQHWYWTLNLLFFSEFEKVLVIEKVELAVTQKVLSIALIADQVCFGYWVMPQWHNTSQTITITLHLLDKTPKLQIWVCFFIILIKTLFCNLLKLRICIL